MYALIDCRADDALLSGLSANGFTIVKIPPADYLSEGVASHTDMLIFIGFGRLFCHERYYEKNKELIESLVCISGLDLVLSSEKTGEKYPLDVIFNACIIGDRLICNEKTVSGLILDSAKSENFEIINIQQGYTKCSVCPVGNGALITSDVSIAAACRTRGLDVLLISEGHISLPPYTHGFIGGASGICGDKIYFCGSLDSHPDGERIKKFCTEHGAEAICLSDKNLQDVGTIFFI